MAQVEICASIPPVALVLVLRLLDPTPKPLPLYLHQDRLQPITEDQAIESMYHLHTQLHLMSLNRVRHQRQIGLQLTPSI